MLRCSPAPGAGPGRAGAAPAGPGAAVAMDRMSWLKADLSPGTGQMPLLLCPIWPSRTLRCQVTLLPRCGDVFAVPCRELPVQPRGEGRDTLWGPRGLTLWREMRSGFVPAHAGWSQSSQCGCMGSPCLRPRWPWGVKLGAGPGGDRSSNSAWWLHGGSGDPRTGTGRQHCPAAGGLSVTGQPEPAAREGDSGGGPGVPGRVTPAPTALLEPSGLSLPWGSRSHGAGGSRAGVCSPAKGLHVLPAPAPCGHLPSVQNRCRVLGSPSAPGSGRAPSW